MLPEQEDGVVVPLAAPRSFAHVSSKATDCPNDSNITGYRLASQGWWREDSERTGKVDSAAHCGERCTTHISCVSFVIRRAKREGERPSCLIYKGSIMKQDQSSVAYMRC